MIVPCYAVRGSTKILLFQREVLQHSTSGSEHVLTFGHGETSLKQGVSRRMTRRTNKIAGSLSPTSARSGQASPDTSIVLAKMAESVHDENTCRGHEDTESCIGVVLSKHQGGTRVLIAVPTRSGARYIPHAALRRTRYAAHVEITMLACVGRKTCRQKDRAHAARARHRQRLHRAIHPAMCSNKLAKRLLRRAIKKKIRSRKQHGLPCATTSGGDRHRAHSTARSGRQEAREHSRLTLSKLSSSFFGYTLPPPQI